MAADDQCPLTLRDGSTAAVGRAVPPAGLGARRVQSAGDVLRQSRRSCISHYMARHGPRIARAAGERWPARDRRAPAVTKAPAAVALSSDRERTRTGGEWPNVQRLIAVLNIEEMGAGVLPNSVRPGCSLRSWQARPARRARSREMNETGRGSRWEGPSSVPGAAHPTPPVAWTAE